MPVTLHDVDAIADLLEKASELIRQRRIKRLSVEMSEEGDCRFSIVPRRLDGTEDTQPVRLPGVPLEAHSEFDDAEETQPGVIARDRKPKRE